MGYLRSTVSAIALAVGLLAATPAPAADVSMANGSVNFSTPDGWLDIMQTDGDPEVRAFQVPDPSPTGHVLLARVTVTVKQVPDINGFLAWMDQATAAAMALPGYQTVAKAPEPNSYSYTAREAGVASSYRERYWFKDGHAIQLRCVRPQQSQAGAAWIAAFDRGCDAVAARLQ
ncbi:hypothetical protein B0E52_04220 [Rhodanobacter sp. C06]|uniref:hypothetical protein n=1 Tax=Rhodanobacter sp. C06 TaxID=1945854 RepID=UPI0009848497|nr:hypothetical protein [Rhodanobacter sp. C06]OOG47276.1 hypothetical protein B0E52_04220 [Rhodanobacter sp. C06]